MKFDMGADVLTNLVKQTDTGGQDLAGLVRRFVQAAEPLAGQFEGKGAAKFADFKVRSDEVADDLTRSLGRILGGQAGMEVAFSQGDDEQEENATRAEGRANFDGARFRSA